MIELFSLTLGQLAKIVGGTLIRGNSFTPVYHTAYQNTKFIGPGKVFLLGTRFLSKFKISDLHSKKSAGIIATHQWKKKVPSHHSLILVKNADEALWNLARWQRKKSKALFIGVTGSQGKTTTKEMLSSILKLKYVTLKTQANNNLAATVPAHLFYLNPKYEAVVLEMGMASLGNIHQQCLYAKPKIGIVTNVGEAHVGSLGSSLKNVARAKQELINGVDSNGFLALNADDAGSKKLSISKFKGKVVYFGIKKPADVRAQNIKFGQDGMHFQVDGVSYRIRTWGLHNVYNALAAIAVALHLKIPTSLIQRGLINYRHPSMRLQKISGINQHFLINDAYNANPTSMTEGLKVLRKLSQNRNSIAVLGDMSELGKHTNSGHDKVGKIVSVTRPNMLVTIGHKAERIARSAISNGFPKNQVRAFSTQANALRYIKKSAPPGSIIYFKASRALGLEWLVKQLRAKKRVSGTLLSSQS